MGKDNKLTNKNIIVFTDLNKIQSEVTPSSKRSKRSKSLSEDLKRENEIKVDTIRRSSDTAYFPKFRHRKTSSSQDFDKPSQSSMFDRDYSKAKLVPESVGKKQNGPF